MLDQRMAPLEQSLQAMREAATAQQQALAGLQEQYDVVRAEYLKLAAASARYHGTVDEISVTIDRLEELQRLACAAASGEGSRERRLCETKDLMPNPLGDDFQATWREWSRKAKVCLARTDTGVSGKLSPLLDI